MWRKKIVLVSPLPEEYQRRLADHFPGLTVVDCSRERDLLAREIRNAHIVFGRVSAEEFREARCLEFIQVWTQGVEAMLYPELVNSPIPVANGRGVWSPALAEHIVALILAFYRRLPDFVRWQRETRWVKRPGGLERLNGKTVCFLGTGDIARHAVPLCRAFGCRILGFNRGGETAPGFDRIFTVPRLVEAVAESDVVVTALPSTPATFHLVNEEVFRAMKRTAFFINVGRGKTVDERALIAALEQGWIAGAGLDVFEKEPLPPESPLWRMENVIITCHEGGVSGDHPERAYALLVDNLERLRDGRPLRNLVDKQRGY